MFNPFIICMYTQFKFLVSFKSNLPKSFSCQRCFCLFQVVPVLLHLIRGLSPVRIYMPQDLRPLDNRMSVLKSIQVQAIFTQITLLGLGSAFQFSLPYAVSNNIFL